MPFEKAVEEIAKRTPLVIFLTGVAILVLGLTGGIPVKLPIVGATARTIASLVGAVLLCFGGVLAYREQHAEASTNALAQLQPSLATRAEEDITEVFIVQPKNESAVSEWFDITGTWKGKLPPNVGACILGRNCYGRYWFETDVVLLADQKTWKAKVYFHPEYGQPIDDCFAVVGQCGTALKEYDYSAGRNHNRWPLIERLPSDVHLKAEITVHS